MHRFLIVLIVLLSASYATGQAIGVNVLLNAPPDPAVLAQLEAYGQVLDVIPEINAVTMRAQAEEVAAIQAIACVCAAGPDGVGYRTGTDDRGVFGFESGANLWNLDAVNVTDYGVGRTVPYDGQGVYVAVIDAGLAFKWRDYLPEDRVDVVHARSFGGGGGNVGTVSTQPNLWEHGMDYHAVACASIILGFRYAGSLALPAVLNGVAPGATVIPINVFGNKPFYWGSVIARAILYATELKVSGELGGAPLVISLSNGGMQTDVLEQAAIDYAISNGVVVVAGAGNGDAAGMLFPGRYPPVISVGATGFVQEFPAADPTTPLWVESDVPEGNPLQHFVAPFSAFELSGQDLDVAAPGFGVPAPGCWNNGQIEYTYFDGTSASAPHVAGVVALMLQKNPNLSASQIEGLLENSAMALSPGCRDVTAYGPGGQPVWSDPGSGALFGATFCWSANMTGYGLVQADAALAATPLP